jgi:peptidoglycan hydrolase-like protein with peptidoglycan-binding domain
VTTATSASAASVQQDAESGQNDSLTLPPSTQSGVEIGSTLPEVQKDLLSSTVAMGSYGNDVKKVQQRLTELGFVPGPADGTSASSRSRRCGRTRSS